MPRVALGMLAVYVALAFGWRTWLQIRRTGSTGFVGLAGGSALQRLGSVLLVASIALAALSPIGALAGWPWAALAATPRPLLGAIAYAFGLALTLWAQLRMGASWRIGVNPAEKTALVTGGPFSFARNPIYTGMLAATLGLGLLVPNAPALVAALALLAGVELQVRLVEEPYLIAQHGDAYLRWARRVGRFLPALGRLR
ncbi:MAG TPA: isoprenylcysteine carboxylmethyltransferase family protein [Myxococcota bacterium]|nr:isoprenylcysteine carboxylmethyltransferase family protein [Myxococcota bacterium]